MYLALLQQCGMPRVSLACHLKGQTSSSEYQGTWHP
jgi:hypothetical protein